jgi:HSP20 family protein
MEQYLYEEPINVDEEGQLSIDVYQTSDELIVQSTVAGVTLDDLEILVHGDMLIVRGKRLPPVPVNPEQYLYRECYWGPFSRTIVLPRDVDASQIKANLKNGLLTIKMPKIYSESFKKVEVEIEK